MAEPPPAKSENPSSTHSDKRRAEEKRRPWLYIVIAVVVVVVVAIILRLVLHKPKPAPAPPPVNVTTAAARHGNIGIYVEALGSVTPIATVAAPSQVSGQLSKVNFVEGQMVQQGDLLAEIDERPFQAQLMSAEGQLERDQALLSEARMDLARYQQAYEHKAIPKQQLDDQTALADQDAGVVKFDQGTVSNAQVQLGYCRITSPISGRVGLRLIDPGNIVLASSTNGVAVVTQLQPITVIFSVAEDYLPAIQAQLKRGKRLAVQALDRADTTNLATGSVLALDNVIDSSTGTIRIRAIFTNEDEALFPNQFVNARLLIDTLRNQTLIPTVAVQRNGAATFVYVITPDKTAQMRNIKVGVTDGDTTSVDGVKPGEVLAVDNFNRLEDGAKVNPREPGEGREQGRGGP